MAKSVEDLIAILSIGILIASVSFICEPATAGTSVTGIISTDTTWSLANSPYWVEDNVTVDIGVNLTIEPGVEVRFNGSYGLYVAGNLTAVGNPSNPIIFTSNKTIPIIGDWNWIDIADDGYVHIEYCSISFAKSGIRLGSTLDNMVANNTITYSSWGIEVVSTSSHNKIIGNNVSLNGLYGISLIVSSNTTVAKNDVRNNSNNGIYLLMASNNTIFANNVSGSNEGITLDTSNNNTIKDNIILSNNYSMELFISTNNTIKNNSIIFGAQGGVHIDNSDGTFITGNNISYNANYCIYTQSSSDVRIYHNDFYSSGTLAQDNTADTIYNDSYLNGGGNFWSDYGGMDDYGGPNQDIPGSDGFGDTWYYIDGNSYDQYPLMHPTTTPLPDTTTPMVTDLQIQPNPQEVQDYVNISANVSDNVEILGVWVHIKKPDSSDLINISMFFSSTDQRYYQNLTYSIIGTFTFDIWAKDTSNNWNSSSGQFTIQDTTNPIADSGPDQQTEQNTTIALNASASWDNYLIDNYTWVLTDGASVLLYGMTPSYTFENVGSFEVTLTVKDSSGNTDTDTVWVNVTANVPPSAPTGLTISVPDEKGKLGLAWTANTENDLAGYNIYRSESAEGPYLKINGAMVTTTTYEDSGLKDGKTYYYKVTAVDAAGNESPQSEWGSGRTMDAPEPPSGDLGWILLVVILLIVLVLIILILLAFRRRKKNAQAGAPTDPARQ